MDKQQRGCIRLTRLDVDEVDVLSVNLCCELRMLVDDGFLGAPVKAVAKVPEQLLDVIESGALRPVVGFDRAGKD